MATDQDILGPVVPENYCLSGYTQRFGGTVVTNQDNVDKSTIKVKAEIFKENTLITTYNNISVHQDGKFIFNHIFTKKGEYTVKVSVGEDYFNFPITVYSSVESVNLSLSTNHAGIGDTVGLHATVVDMYDSGHKGISVQFVISEDIASFSEEKSINDYEELDYNVHTSKITSEFKAKGQLAISVKRSDGTETILLQVTNNSYVPIKIIDDGVNLKVYQNGSIVNNFASGVKELFVYGNGYVKDFSLQGNDSVSGTTSSLGAVDCEYVFPGGDLEIVAQATFAEETTKSSVAQLTENSFDGITLTSDKSILSSTDNESAILTAQLTKNGNSASVSGQTVTFEVRKQSDDSLVETLTGNTNSSGIATVSYSGKGVGDIYIKAECNLVSETYSIEDTIFYDDATSDKLYLYDIANQITVYGSNSDVRMTYNSANKYYILTNPSGGSTGFVPINNLVGVDNIRYEMEIYLDTGTSGLNLGIGLLNLSIQIFNIPNQDKPLNIYDSANHLISGATTRRVWSKLIVEVRGNKLDITLKNNNGTVNCTTTYNMPSSVSSNTQYGLCLYSNQSNQAYLKNIVIKPL